MGFETIGPYALSRRDLVAAAVVISFVTGSKATRWKSWVVVAVGVSLIILGISTGDIFNMLLGAGLPVLLFVIAPSLRSLKQVNHIQISCSVDGLVAETPIVRTTYKWSTIGVTRKLGARLYIMISPAHALVLPDRATSAENARRLIACIDQHMDAGSTA